METKVGVISIIVENSQSVAMINEILHTFSEYIIGRMGIPHREKNISIISIALDAPQDIFSALAGKIGNLEGVSAKTVIAKS